jgi:ligand-binding sensor domain-containing protein
MKPFLHSKSLSSILGGAVFFGIVLMFTSPTLSQERFRWTLYTQAPLGDKEVHMIHVDSVGNRWFGTENGLVVLTQSENWEEHDFRSTQGMLFSDSILCMGVDEYGDVWVGTTRGLSVYSNGHWMQHTHQSTQGGLPSNHVRSLSIDPNGSIWIGTDQGFAQLENGLWNSYPTQKIVGKVPQVYIHAIEADGEGGVWLGTAEGLVHFDGVVYSLYTKESTEEGLPDNYVSSIQRGSKNTLWVGTQKGLGKLEQDIWQTISSKTVLNFPGDLVYRVLAGKASSEDEEDIILVCVRGGLAYLSQEGWQFITKENSDAALLSRRVYGALVEGDKELWIATRGGVSRRSKILR